MKAQRNWSIGERLGAGFAALLVVLGAFIVAVFVWLGQSERAQTALTEEVLPRVARADRLERALLEAGIAARAYLYERTEAHLADFERSAGRLRDAARHLGAAELDAPSRRRYEELEGLVEAYLRESAALVRAPQAGAQAALTSLRDGIVAGVGAFSAAERSMGDAALAELAGNRGKIVNSLLTGSLLTLLLFGVVGYLTTQSVRRPVHALLGVAGALARGDWKPALDLAPAAGTPANGEVRDEMRRLGHALGAAAGALEVREQRLRADARISAAVGSTLEKRALAQSALGAVLEHVQGEVGAIYWREPPEDALVPLARYALEEEPGTLRIGEGLPGQAAKERRPVVVRDIPRDTPFRVKLGYDEAPPSTVAALPIVFRQELLGVLVVGSLRPLGDAALEFLGAAAAQLAIGLKNVQAYEQIQQLLAEVQAQNEEIQAQNEEIQAQVEEIHAQNEEIQAQNDDLKRYSDAQREQAAHLQHADARKNEFLGVLAHELRNPLAPMVNGMQLLRLQAPGSESYERTKALIERQLRHLTRLIDDLLDVTRISRGKIVIRRERLNLVQLVHECLEDQRASIESRGLGLELDLPETPVRIDADYTRLCQVLSNLLANAVKFTEPGSRIRVTVSLHPDEREVAVHIADDGIGIDPALLPQIFEPFSQGESELARPKGGLGLGLALAKTLVELHHGRIEARSDGPGKGAEFVLRLPLPEAEEPAGEPASPTEPVAASGARPAGLLIVDDNVDAAQTLAALLRAEGYEVAIAVSAAQALEVAGAARPEAILCDIGLPGMDGYELARRLRATPGLENARLIAITGYATEADRRRAVEAGFDAHIAKPAHVPALVALMHPEKGSDPISREKGV